MNLKLGPNDLKSRCSMTAQDIAQSCEKLIQKVLKAAKYDNGHAPEILPLCPKPMKG